MNRNIRYGNPKQSQYHFNYFAQLSSAVGHLCWYHRLPGVSFNSGNDQRFKMSALTPNIQVYFLLQITGTRTAEISTENA